MRWLGFTLGSGRNANGFAASKPFQFPHAGGAGIVGGMQTFVIATRNRHKVGEIQAVLGAAHRYVTLADLPGAPEVVEDAPTFAGNASKKACELAGWLAGLDGGDVASLRGALVLADDSGLEVDALNGAPGVLSARFAALDSPGTTGNAPDADNNAKLLRLLQAVPAERRTARFRCVIALATVGNVQPPRLFEGTCEGTILTVARGGAGFGYDPLFQPNGFVESFAELGEVVKNHISHRARALAAMAAALANP